MQNPCFVGVGLAPRKESNSEDNGSNSKDNGSNSEDNGSNSEDNEGSSEDNGEISAAVPKDSDAATEAGGWFSIRAPHS